MGWKRGRGQRPFYGWVIVAVGLLVAFSSGPGQSYVFSVFLDSIIEDTGLSRTTISALFSAGTGASAVLVLATSRLADRYSPRRTLILAALVFGAACFWLAFAAGAVSVVLAFATLRALGQASLPIHATLLTAQWFVRRRGWAMAIMGLGFAASNAVLPPLSRLGIDHIGWQETYMALGVMVWALVLPGAIFLVRNRPEEMGLYPDGDPHPPAHETPVPRSASGRDTRKIFTSPTFWLLALPMMTVPFVATALTFHQSSIFAERGLSAGIAAWAFVPYAIAVAVASLLAGAVLDRAGPTRVFIANMAILTVGVVLALVISSPALATIYALILGTAIGVFLLLQGTLWAHFYGRHGLGRVQGAGMMLGISASALGPLPIAALQEATGSYDLAIVLMAGLPIIAVLLFAVARPASVLVRQPGTD